MMEWQDNPEQQGSPVRQELLDQKEIKEPEEVRVLLEHLGPLDLRVQLDQTDHLETVDQQDHWVEPEQPEHRVTVETQDYRVILVQPEQLESRVLLDIQETRASVDL
jgi:hypothetical protein